MTLCHSSGFDSHGSPGILPAPAGTSRFGRLSVTEFQGARLLDPQRGATRLSTRLSLRLLVLVLVLALDFARLLHHAKNDVSVCRGPLKNPHVLDTARQ